MSRYIDAVKVLKELHLNHKDVIYIDKNECAKRIEKIPSIDIVRCKECKWHDTCCRNIYEDWRDATPTDIEYCSFGEREGE